MPPSHPHRTLVARATMSVPHKYSGIQANIQLYIPSSGARAVRLRAVHLHQPGPRRPTEAVSVRVQLPEQQHAVQPAWLLRDLEYPRHVLLGQGRQPLGHPRCVLLLALRNVRVRLGLFPCDLPRHVREVALFGTVGIDSIDDLLQVARQASWAQVECSERWRQCARRGGLRRGVGAGGRC